MSGPAGTRRAIATAVLYGGALLLGFALVSVPSSSVHLQAAYGFTERQYGQLFVPQLLLAIGGALLAGPFVKRVSLKAMYAVALVAFGGSQAALATSSEVATGVAFVMVMASTGLFGFGFGFGGGPLNGLVAELYPSRSAAAITGLHLMAGVGLMLGPLYFRAFEAADRWSAGPALLGASALLLLAAALVVLQASRPLSEIGGTASPGRSQYFWLMIFIAFLYALVEGAFSNWAVIYVSVEKAATRDAGALALAAFWGGLTAGRLLATFTVTHIGAARLWMTLPLLMLSAFLVLPALETERGLILGYGLAGLACSAFFPLMVTVAAKPFPEHLSWIASMLTAALMLGVGVGSWVMGEAASILPIARMYLYFAAVPVLTLIAMWLCLRPAARPA